LRCPGAPAFIEIVTATLIESPDEHHWVLLDHQVTQLVVEAGSFRVQTWALDASAEIRCAAPFVLRQPSGAERVIDPDETETLAPVLSLLRRRLESITVTREGELTAQFSGGLTLAVLGRPRTPAWEVQGAGALEGMSYTGALPSAAERG
jgi:hypothetical protein